MRGLRSTRVLEATLNHERDRLRVIALTPRIAVELELATVFGKTGAKRNGMTPGARHACLASETGNSQRIATRQNAEHHQGHQGHVPTESCRPAKVMPHNR